MITKGASGDACQSCMYWASAEERDGECRRYPPTVQLPTTALKASGAEAETRYTAHWPVTAQDDWCGEYAAVEAPV